MVFADSNIRVKTVLYYQLSPTQTLIQFLAANNVGVQLNLTILNSLVLNGGVGDNSSPYNIALDNGTGSNKLVRAHFPG